MQAHDELGAGSLQNPRALQYLRDKQRAGGRRARPTTAIDCILLTSTRHLSKDNAFLARDSTVCRLPAYYYVRYPTLADLRFDQKRFPSVRAHFTGH